MHGPSPRVLTQALAARKADTSRPFPKLLYTVPVSGSMHVYESVHVGGGVHVRVGVWGKGEEKGEEPA